ncbi:unnamed protein product [Acanthoscelides obtectus]|uniref:Uncharacterized protein n=1 Tax=Acanthoscelides obtectus TaxID=200917 RepID=A0A9P0M606_ACAOB|nr:unnamed protein product [Acanthoscelides obtectus]CAK1644071.1 hypothetical protein AOBTE_LOCUS13809 [Acanthoscelides obtectus]
MVFSMRSLPGDSDLVGEAKFLGVTLDPRLQWGLHIDSVAGKATKGIYVPRCLSSCVSVAILRMAYFAICHSHNPTPFWLGGILQRSIDCSPCKEKQLGL